MVPLAIFPRMLDFLNTWEIFEHFIHSMQCFYSTGTSAIVYILEWKDKGTNADSDPVAIVTCFSPRCNLPCFVFLIASIFKKKKKSGANQSFPSHWKWLRTFTQNTAIVSVIVLAEVTSGELFWSQRSWTNGSLTALQCFISYWRPLWGWLRALLKTKAQLLCGPTSPAEDGGVGNSRDKPVTPSAEALGWACNRPAGHQWGPLPTVWPKTAKDTVLKDVF